MRAICATSEARPKGAPRRGGVPSPCKLQAISAPYPSFKEELKPRCRRSILPRSERRLHASPAEQPQRSARATADANCKLRQALELPADRFSVRWAAD